MSHQGGHLGAWAFNRKWQPLPETHAWPHLRHASGTCEAGNAFAQCMFNACSVCHPSDTSTANIAVQELGPSTAVSTTQLQIEKLFTPPMKLVKRTVSGFFFTPRVLCPEESCGNNMVRKVMEACPPRGTAKSPENSTPILQKKSPLSQMLGPVPICPNLPTRSASAGCGAQVYQGKEEREIHDYTENIFSQWSQTALAWMKNSVHTHGFRIASQ